jgi:stress-induced morphogen
MADVLKMKLEAADALQPVELCEVADKTGGGTCQGGKFAVIVVSKRFEGMGLLDRHRLVQGVLAEEMKVIHALEIKALTPEVYAQRKAEGKI